MNYQPSIHHQSTTHRTRFIMCAHSFTELLIRQPRAHNQAWIITIRHWKTLSIIGLHQPTVVTQHEHQRIIIATFLTTIIINSHLQSVLSNGRLIICNQPKAMTILVIVSKPLPFWVINALTIPQLLNDHYLSFHPQATSKLNLYEWQILVVRGSPSEVHQHSPADHGRSPA